MAALMAARRRRRQTTGGSIPGTSMTNPDYQALTLEGEDADSLITPGMAEESMSANVLMGTTPQPAECIKIGNMEKMMDSELKWSDRTVYLTRTELGLALPDAGSLKDVVLLHLIKNVAAHSFKDVGDSNSPSTTDLLKANSHAWGQLQTHTDGESKAILRVQTIAEESSGAERPYFFRTDSDATAKDWIEKIQSAADECKRALERRERNSIQRFQKMAHTCYVSSPFQNAVAVLISANFVINATQSEMHPQPGTTLDRVFSELDMVFTIIFAVELGINLMAHWFRPFWSDGWSVFDFIVVTVSLLALFF
mmetsp:Transcript_29155/g.46957  ORF Transcript_29155/g.46957 Transcript_29155/m.46957 type:complete len:310 (+) Transcript_29155:591-1520(+)